MNDDIRWTLKVSRDTDMSLRSFLGRRGMTRGDLSKFVERAVRKEVLAQTTASLKARYRDIPYARLQAIIDRSVSQLRSARASRRRRP